MISAFEWPTVPSAISTESLFRYRVVADVLARVMMGTAQAVAVQEAAETAHVYFLEVGIARPKRLSQRTIYRWVRAFKRGGFAALERRQCVRKPGAKAIEPELLAFLKDEKTKDLAASIPELLRRAKAQGKYAGKGPHRATVHRALTALGVWLTVRSSKRDKDMRKFAFAHRMRMVLVDGKQFRAGAGRLRRVAFFFIDDATRRTLWVVVGTSESSELMLRGLFEVCAHYGMMDVIFMDHGAGFVAHDTHRVCARLGIKPILGKKRYPEGHGKIERFNRTVWNDCLRGLCAVDVDPEPRALEIRIQHYIDTQYNTRNHESLPFKTSPEAHWNADPRPLRFAASIDELRARFSVTETRRVSADNVVSLDGVFYEMPRGYAKTRITVHRHVLDGHIHVLHEQRLVRLWPVDLAANADARRSTSAQSVAADPEATAPLTAAAMAFSSDLGPAPPLALTKTTPKKQKP